jgi:exodeoxyribonuclease III
MTKRVQADKSKAKKTQNEETLEPKMQQKKMEIFFTSIQQASKTEKWKKAHPAAKLNTVYAWNVNGLKARVASKEFERFMAAEKPQVLCLSEVKSKPIDEFIKQYKEYDIYWHPSERVNYRGTALLSLQKPLNVSIGIGIPRHDAEGRVITAEYEKHIVVCTYVPYAGDMLKRMEYKKEWWADFEIYLKSLREKGKMVVVCGDLNVAHHEIDLANPKSNVNTPGFTLQEREHFTKFLGSDYIDTYRHFYPRSVAYSFWTNKTDTSKKNNAGWRLDYFLMTGKHINALVESQILDQYDDGDHCPIKLTIDTSILYLLLHIYAYIIICYDLYNYSYIQINMVDCKSKVVPWIIKAVAIAVFAFMAIVGIVRFTRKYTNSHDGGRVVILFYVEGLYMILLAALAITNMFVSKLKNLFKIFQSKRGMGIFMVIISFFMFEWKIKHELACFILMLLIGAGHIVMSFVIKEEEAITS